MRRAYFDVSQECLRHALHLPAGTKIIRVLDTIDPLRTHSDIRIIVESNDLNEVREGDLIPRVLPMLKTTVGAASDKVEFVSWGQAHVS